MSFPVSSGVINRNEFLRRARLLHNPIARRAQLLHNANNGLGNNPLDAINATVLKRGRFTRPPAPNNGLGNNPLDAINATVLKRGRFTRRSRRSRRTRRTRR